MIKVRAAAAGARRAVRPDAKNEREEEEESNAGCKDEELEEALAILACGRRGRAGRGVGRGRAGRRRVSARRRGRKGERVLPS